jgi:hypothetical protein
VPFFRCSCIIAKVSAFLASRGLMLRLVVPSFRASLPDCAPAPAVIGPVGIAGGEEGRGTDSRDEEARLAAFFKGVSRLLESAAEGT